MKNKPHPDTLARYKIVSDYIGNQTPEGWNQLVSRVLDTLKGEKANIGDVLADQTPEEWEALKREVCGVVVTERDKLHAALLECVTADGARCMIDESRNAASFCRRRLDEISRVARAAITDTPSEPVKTAKARTVTLTVEELEQLTDWAATGIEGWEDGDAGDDQLTKKQALKVCDRIYARIEEAKG